MSIQCEWSFSFYPVPVNCTDGQIRLRGGTTVREGRVEICISGVWGTICDTFWDSREARVVCRQLGFLSIGENTKSTLLVGGMLKNWQLIPGVSGDRVIIMTTPLQLRC